MTKKRQGEMQQNNDETMSFHFPFDLVFVFLVVVAAFAFPFAFAAGFVAGLAFGLVVVVFAVVFFGEAAGVVVVAEAGEVGAMLAMICFFTALCFLRMSFCAFTTLEMMDGLFSTTRISLAEIL